jgi:hypothetical protein
VVTAAQGGFSGFLTGTYLLCAVVVAVGPSGGGSGDRGLTFFPSNTKKLRPGWDSGKEWLMEAESCVAGGWAMGTGVTGASAGRVLVLPSLDAGLWFLLATFFL